MGALPEDCDRSRAADQRTSPPPRIGEGDFTERKDVERLFDLLEKLYTGSKRSRDSVTVAIWDTVLKPWSYAQVRDAAIRRARENRYYPDPSELAEYLPIDAAHSVVVQKDDFGRRMREAWNEAKRIRLERGVPETIGAAREVGMSAAAWLDLLDKEGCGVCLEATP